MIRFILFLSINFGVFADLEPKPISSNCISNVTAMIIRDGFHGEEHKVITKDGYILTIHRVSHCKNTIGVVLLLHGLLSSAVDWLVLGSENALAYLLAKHCYDVWLMNFRGNDYSQEHVRFDPRTYWDFSWHEMGLYDIPATIDYVSSITGETRVSVVCLSQGCPAVFVSGILNPYLNDKIKVTCALAPAVLIGNTENQPLRLLAKLIEFPAQIGFGTTTHYKFSITDAKELIATFCLNVMPEICESLLNFGFDLSETNKTVIPTVLCNAPSGISTKQLIHFGKLINCNCFSQYDYGSWQNLLKYNSFQPPSYDLGQFKAPVYVFGGTKDKMVVAVDAHRTASELPNLIGERYVRTTHIDFVYGEFARNLVYEPLMEECLAAKGLA